MEVVPKEPFGSLVSIVDCLANTSDGLLARLSAFPAERAAKPFAHVWDISARAEAFFAAIPEAAATISLGKSVSSFISAKVTVRKAVEAVAAGAEFRPLLLRAHGALTLQNLLVDAYSGAWAVSPQPRRD